MAARGFQMAPFIYDTERVWPESHVFVLDLMTPELSRERKEALVKEAAARLSQRRRPTVLVIYVSGVPRVEAVKDLPGEFNYIMSNMRGTLIGAVVDAAQIAQALRSEHR